jgi:hypothetical protein
MVLLSGLGYNWCRYAQNFKSKINSSSKTVYFTENSLVKYKIHCELNLYFSNCSTEVASFHFFPIISRNRVTTFHFLQACRTWGFFLGKHDVLSVITHDQFEGQIK